MRGSRAVLFAVALTTVRVGAQPAPANTATLTVKLVGMRDDRGVARVAVFGTPAGFPGDHKRALAGGGPPIRGGVATIRFDGLRAGRVAVSAFHDADGNGKLKRGLFGRPKEGYGFSRNARARFGPPDFADAAIVLRGGQHTAIEIRIRY